MYFTKSMVLPSERLFVIFNIQTFAVCLAELKEHYQHFYQVLYGYKPGMHRPYITKVQNFMYVLVDFLYRGSTCCNNTNSVG